MPSPKKSVKSLTTLTTLRTLTDAKPRAVELVRTAEARTDARSAGRNCLQVMPSKEEENSHSEVKEEKTA